MVKVKICGLTNGPDARLALELGADFAGFVFYPRSPRAAAPAIVREIIRESKAGSRSNASFVGVFVNEEAEIVRRIFGQCGLDIAQLHGDETPEYCRCLGLPYWKAVRVKDESSLLSIESYGGDAVLLDTFTEGNYGGTGRAFPISVVRAAVERGLKIVVAGGISSANLPAVLAARPWAVDVSSALEERPGKKDAIKMREFFRKIREIGGRP